MRDEHYTEKEIENKSKEVFARNEHLMRKYVARMRLRQDHNRRIMPAVWNRWRQFTAMRKLIRYQV